MAEFEHPRNVLRRHGLTPNRKHSQNFLTASWAIDAIADASVPADPEETGGTVLELGPGAGTLTAALLARGARVRAIEKDPNLVKLLHSEFLHAVADGRLSVVHGDAATAALDAAHLVGNLPYAITGKILRNIVEHRASLKRATIMIQREVADRLRATPGNKSYGLLSVMVQNNFSVMKVCEVSAGNFFPPPKVDSTVVQLARRDASLVAHTETFERVVRAAFGQRRKTLKRALASVFNIDESVLRRAQAQELDLTRRAEMLSIEEFGRLVEVVAEQSTDPAS